MTRKTKTMLNELLMEEYKREHKIPSYIQLGTWKNVFEVADESGNVIDTLPRLKDAKAKYENI